MFYVLVRDGEEPVYPYTVTDFRVANPNVSMRAQMEPASLIEHGLYLVTPADQPNFNSLTQNCARTAEYGEDGWQEVWVVSDASPEDAARRLADKRGGMIVTPAQAKLALLEAGEYEAAVAAVQGAGLAAEIYWASALSFERLHPLIEAIGAMIWPSLTEQQRAERLDIRFEAAAAIT